MIDGETRKWLNLLHSSPSFVIRIDAKTGVGTVRSPTSVPANDGAYWVAGETRLKSGTTLASVFQVQTSSGGALIGGFWRIGDDWFDLQDDQAFRVLASSRDQETPFDWSYAVPLSEDMYHD